MVYSKIIVNSGFKFVALMLALLLGSGAVSSLFALCVPPAQLAGMQCPPDCPMMMTHQCATDNQAQSNQQPGPCCQFSPDKSAPASLPQATAGPGQTGLQPVKVASAMPIPASPKKKKEPVPIGSDISPQAVLCTFLI